MIKMTVVVAPSPAHILLLHFQWTVCGRNGVNGQHVGLSAPTGGGESAMHQLLKTAARTARAWCSNPRTVLTACACRVSNKFSSSDCVILLKIDLTLLIFHFSHYNFSFSPFFPCH